MLTARRKGEYTHLSLLDALDWGLIVYDEVHLLPAPVFKLTADLQARRRLGLTATLVREDGREGDVFSLIGPKRYDAPWKEIEAQGYISPAECYEVRIDLPHQERLEYAASSDDERYRLAATSPAKTPVVREAHREAPRRADPGDRAVHRPARRTGGVARRGRDHGCDPGRRT
ncbi:DEAD/DEAH box helicase [Curtobacterium sp. 24E2]